MTTPAENLASDLASTFEDQDFQAYAPSEDLYTSSGGLDEDDGQSPSQVSEGRSEFICVLVWKSTAQEHLGVHFQSYTDGSVRISEIEPESLLHDSPLVVGDFVVSINQVLVHGNGFHEALHQLRQHAGAVAIVVQTDGNPTFLTTSINKPFPKVALGMEFRSVQGGLEIADCGALTPKTMLKPFDRVLAVNRISCTYLRPSEASEIIDNAQRWVTLETTSTTLVSSHPAGTNHRLSKQKISAEKASDSRQGFHVPEVFENNDVISVDSRIVGVPAMAVSEEEIFENEQERIFFGTSPCERLPGATSDFAQDEPVSLYSENPEIGDLFTSVVGWKPTAETPLGIKFQFCSDGSLRISEIARTSLFANSSLRIGSVVVSINDIPCLGRGYREALDAVRLMDGAVTIVFRSNEGDVDCDGGR